MTTNRPPGQSGGFWELPVGEQLALIRSQFGKRLFGANQSAAMDAILTCLAEPGALVRVTCTNVEQVNETLGFVIDGLFAGGCIDYQKTIESQDEGGGAILELINGSAIEFKLDKGGSKTDSVGKLIFKPWRLYPISP